MDDVYVTSAAIKVAPDADIVVKGRKKFVSRGGHKLQGALDAFGQDVSGMLLHGHRQFDGRILRLPFCKRAPAAWRVWT